MIVSLAMLVFAYAIVALTILSISVCDQHPPCSTLLPFGLRYQFRVCFTFPFFAVLYVFETFSWQTGLLYGFMDAQLVHAHTMLPRYQTETQLFTTVKIAQASDPLAHSRLNNRRFRPTVLSVVAGHII
jgi:hypothetical protein